MRLITALGFIGLLAMTSAIGFGFIAGDFVVDGGELLQNPWGIVSLVDLYVGFVLFSVWIAYREQNLVSKILWIAAMLTLGFFTGALYVLLASLRSKTIEEFFMGARARSS